MIQFHQLINLEVQKTHDYTKPLNQRKRLFMSTVSAIKSANKVKNYRLFIESHTVHFANVKATNKEDALSQINDFNIDPPTLTIRDFNNNQFDIEAAEDWYINVTGIENQETGEMEDVRLMTHSEAFPEDHPFKANLPENVLDALKAEQDKLFHAAENSDAYFHQSALNGFEKALRLIGVTIPYPKDGEPK